MTVPRDGSVTASFRASTACAVRSKARIVRPRQGLYLNLRRPSILLNYSCRSRVVVASFNMPQPLWDDCRGRDVWRLEEIYGRPRLYSPRMAVSEDGRFAGPPIQRGRAPRYRFRGVFDGPGSAEVTFEFPDCLLVRSDDALVWVGETGIRF